jgi:hypothetical protein
MKKEVFSVQGLIELSMESYLGCIVEQIHPQELVLLTIVGMRLHHSKVKL